jgi:hypothetical protein
VIEAEEAFGGVMLKSRKGDRIRRCQPGSYVSGHLNVIVTFHAGC